MTTLSQSPGFYVNRIGESVGVGIAVVAIWGCPLAGPHWRREGEGGVTRFSVSTFSIFLSGSIPERREEMSKWALIYKSYMLTLNQRVQGSSPCAPTNEINGLVASPASATAF